MFSREQLRQTVRSPPYSSRYELRLVSRRVGEPGRE